VEVVTLTDFLLGRIAEDEAAAEQRVRVRRRLRPDLEAGSFGTMPTPAQVLAECKAKRRIVERCLELDPESESFGGHVPMLHGQGMLEAICHLATVYADHPDYREEWKP
jgi:hypothetical protein